MFEGDSKSIPSIFEVVKESFPPGTELIEVVTPDGRVYAGEELKAIEWQEQKMRLGETDPLKANGLDVILDRLSQGLAKPRNLNKTRTLKSLFKFQHGKIMICNDDTVWFLAPEVGACWERCEVDGLPQIPQEA